MGSKRVHARRAVRGLPVIANLLVVGGVARADAGGSPHGIYVVSADGSERTQLTSNPWGDTNPAWSPDGTEIAFGHNSTSIRMAQAPHRRVPIYGAIYVMNADGSDPHPLTEPASGCFDTEPAWSPDGTTIVFARHYSGPTSDIFAMNADGSGLRNLTNAPGREDTAPAWSPDGTKIAFAISGTGLMDIYVMNSDGTDQRPLASSPLSGAAPAWSPDGTLIAFSKWTAHPTYEYDIAVIGSDGSGERRLTNDIGSDLGPAWSPDGTKVAFGRAGAGIWSSTRMEATSIV